MRSPVSARVTGFDYSTFHAYTTEVAVDGRSWTLAIRYNTFFKFYCKLLEVEPHFKAPFPPKGGIFFSPLPEERQVQLDDFVQNTLTFYDLRGRPDPMGALVDDLLEISDHLKPDEAPIDDQQDAAEPDAEEEKQAVELPAADVEAPQTAKDEVVETVQPKEETAKPKAKEDGGFMSSLWGKAVSAAIQAVVVNTFQENVEAAKTAPKVDESAAPAKSLDSDFETPTSPVSRGSFSKTPRQSATVTPLVVPAASPASLKPEVPRQEPITVATVGVRDRIASWERAMSKSSSPSTSKPSSPTAGPRGAGRRSSSCSSAGDHAPIVPVGAADMPKLVKTEEEIAKQAKAEEEKTVSPVMTGEESVKPVETKEEVAEPMVETEEETVVPVVETPVVEEKAVVASESNEVAAEETSEEAEKEEANESEPAQTSTEDSAAVESSVEEATKVESVAKTPESVEEPVVVVDETAKEAVEVEADKEVAVEEPQPKEEAAESSQDAYDSDASDEIRQLKLEKIDLDERLRFYRQPVFFQGFYCRVHRMSVIEDDLRL